MFIRDQETVVDLLYYRAIAETIAELIRDTSGAPVTIGVHGDWGAGKSSVLEMTKQTLAKDEDTVVLYFNGWQFQGFEDAKVVLIETILSELKEQRPTVSKLVDTLRKRVDWLKIAKRAAGALWTSTTGIPTPDQMKGAYDTLKSIVSKPENSFSIEAVKKIAEQAGEHLKNAEPNSVPEQIHAFHREFSELLDAAEITQLVVVIDDLDRCLPHTAIETLEAIRLFLFAPKTAFVIASDEGMIEYAVKKYFPDLPLTAGAATYARNYLEKLIQIPFRIPALGYAETRTYVTLILAQAALGEASPDFRALLRIGEEALKRPWLGLGIDRAATQKALGSIPQPIEDSLRLSGQLSRLLTEGTRGNPRQIKRFLNSVLLRAEIARARGFGNDIQIPILAKITLAERFAPEFFDELSRLAATDGKPARLVQLEDEVRSDSASDTKKSTARDGDEWPTGEWAKSWAKIDPPLKDVDLRPYLFVSRDKRSAFGIVATLGNLDHLLEHLSGPTLAVRQVEPEIGRLTRQDAEQIFFALCARVSETNDFTREPNGVKGLVAIAKSHPWLQIALVGFIRNLPTGSLGAWATAGWAPGLTEPSAIVEYQKVLASWADQAENQVLRKAAVAIGRLPARKGV